MEKQEQYVVLHGGVGKVAGEQGGSEYRLCVTMAVAPWLWLAVFPAGLQKLLLNNNQRTPDPSWVETLGWSRRAPPLQELAARVAVRGEYTPAEVPAPLVALMEAMVVCPLCGNRTSESFRGTHKRVKTVAWVGLGGGEEVVVGSPLVHLLLVHCPCVCGGEGGGPLGGWG